MPRTTNHPPTRRISGPATLATAATLLAACSAVRPVPTNVATTGMPNPETALRQSLRTVEAQMGQLGGLSPAAARYVPGASPRVARAQGPVLPEPLLRTVSFDWTGSLEDGVARLAQSVGYTFFLTAAPGHTPLEVQVNLRDVPAHEALRALGEQAGTRATVRLVPTHSQVQVIYHG